MQLRSLPENHDVSHALVHASAAELGEDEAGVEVRHMAGRDYKETEISVRLVAEKAGLCRGARPA